MEQEDFLKELLGGLQTLASDKSFDFLKDEEDLYTQKDIKAPYPESKL